MEYGHLREFCETDRQKEALSALESSKTQKEAAEKLGITDVSIKRILKRIRLKASENGEDARHGVIKRTAEGFVLDKTSTLYGSDGELKLTWHKASKDKEAQAQSLMDFVNALKDDISPVDLSDIKLRHAVDKKLINLFTLTDVHIGDWARKELGGDDWDLDLADHIVSNVMGNLIAESPFAKTAVLSLLGDLLHYDSALVSETPHSRNHLDTSGTLQTIAPVAARLLQRIIQLLLQTHEEVVISIVRGNHDEAATVWLRTFLPIIYQNEPRVKVLEGRLDYLAFTRGNLMLGWHHGDKAKPEQLPLIFATEFGKEWGSAEFRELHCGDKHHHKSQDIHGVEVIQHETMNGRNRYTTGKGLKSRRGATRYTYHIDFGRRGSGHVGVESIEMVG